VRKYVPTSIEDSEIVRKYHLAIPGPLHYVAIGQYSNTMQAERAQEQRREDQQRKSEGAGQDLWEMMMAAEREEKAVSSRVPSRGGRRFTPEQERRIQEHVRGYGASGRRD